MFFGVIAGLGSVALLLRAPTWGAAGLAASLLIYGLSARERSILVSGVAGERHIRELLARLPDQYTVVSNLWIHHQGQASELDHVVVGPTGLYVVETKNHNGRITGFADADEWRQQKTGRGGGHYESTMHNPIKQVKTHVHRMAGYMHDHGLRVWVDGVVIFSNPAADVQITGGNVPVFAVSHEGAQRLLQYFRQPHGEGLSPAQVARVVEALRQTAH